jgi:diaminohydroxyphosphoribosylaminopyrimidine deaminase/5-amino-6-(5-phosphoribosylamino)uracil reductase
LSKDDDLRFMARALKLARRGMYTTDPNPRVGCVVVKDGAVVGEGWHRRAGEPHAEINALQAAGSSAAGAGVYVTLEPCRHQGRTGPCTPRLIEAGVGRVVAAMRDPNPAVAGGGLDELRSAGIEVREGILAGEAAALNPGFISRMSRGRPYVRLKLAMTLDGRTALASGEARWITGPDARRDVQRLRARSSAILTGIGSVLSDDPRLDVRHDFGDGGEIRQPLRVVVDSGLRTPPSAQLLQVGGPVLIATLEEHAAGRAPLENAGAEVVGLPPANGRVDLQALLTYLAGRGINELHAECGPTLAGALISANLVDELVVYVAPALLGADAMPLAFMQTIADMNDRVGLRFEDTRAVGGDIRLTARPLAKPLD